MGKIRLAIFDLSGTTVSDDNAVAKCLYEGARHFGLGATIGDFEKTIGTNKIHLYEFMLARDFGEQVQIENLENYSFPQYHEKAVEIFKYYSVLMIDYYRKGVKAIPGAEETFRWCHKNGIKVVTDTGFHKDVNRAIMEGLQWKERGLVDFMLDVEDTDGIGRPAPYMIFKAMALTGIQSVHEVIKVGDTPADLISGYNAGCKGNIGVLSGANKLETLQIYPHTHIINSVADLPALITKEFSGTPIKLQIV
jgi:phosphonatase-like hydrolase